MAASIGVKALSAKSSSSANTGGMIRESDLRGERAECFGDDENKVINAEIFRGVRSTDNGTPTRTIKAAMQVHFRTRKRKLKLKQANSDKAVKKSQRWRSRLNTKRRLRQMALQEATSISQEEKEKYGCVMTVDYMSSEHTASEDEEQDSHHERSSDDEPPLKKFSSHPLPGRSGELNRVMETLERKVQRKRGAKGRNMLFERKKGANLNRPVPDDAPAWAV